MTRPLWNRFDRSDPDTCETLSSLISPYADGMASPDESLRVEGHLPSCPLCRQSLLWMQATRRAMASRPVVLPPPDLRARIARSIAEVDAAPSLLRPARVFTLRPAYAAAASLSVVAALVGLGLLQTQPPAHVVPRQPVKVATAPMSALPVPAKAAVPEVAVKTSPTHPLVAQARPHLRPEKVASGVPDDAPETLSRDMMLAPPPVHLNAPAPKANAVENALVHVRPRVLPRKKPMSPRSSVALMASSHVPVRSGEDRAPKPDVPVTRHPDAAVASAKAPDVHIPVQVAAPVVTNDAPPAVRTASATSGPLGAVQAYIHVHQTGYEHDLSLAGRTAVRTATRTAAFHTAAITSGTEGSEAYQDIVH